MPVAVLSAIRSCDMRLVVKNQSSYRWLVQFDVCYSIAQRDLVAVVEPLIEKLSGGTRGLSFKLRISTTGKSLSRGSWGKLGVLDELNRDKG